MVTQSCYEMPVFSMYIKTGTSSYTYTYTFRSVSTNTLISWLSLSSKRVHFLVPGSFKNTFLTSESQGEKCLEKNKEKINRYINKIKHKKFEILPLADYLLHLKKRKGHISHVKHKLPHKDLLISFRLIRQTSISGTKHNYVQHMNNTAERNGST